MGRLDDAAKGRAEEQARLHAMVEQAREQREAQLRAEEEEYRLSEEQGRELSEEFLNEVRTRQLEPNDAVNVETTKREWVRRSNSRGRKSWGWSEEAVISRTESGRCFTMNISQFDPEIGRQAIMKLRIDPTTGHELVAEKNIVEALPAIKRWIGRRRPATEIWETSFVPRPLRDRPGLALAMVDFLEQQAH